MLFSYDGTFSVPSMLGVNFSPQCVEFYISSGRMFEIPFRCWFKPASEGFRKKTDAKLEQIVEKLKVRKVHHEKSQILK